MERENKVVVKYPEIREVLKKLYKDGFRAGRFEGQEGSDGYDFSSAYVEIEKILDK